MELPPTIYVVTYMGHVARILRGNHHDIHVVELETVVEDSIYTGHRVPALEEGEVAGRIEVLFADMPVIVKYRDRLTNLKWVNTTMNGADLLMKSLNPTETLPRFILTKTSGKINAPYLTEYVIGQIIANEKHFYDARDCQDAKQWSQWSGSLFRKTRSLTKLTIGILGVGEIGRVLAKVCASFGMTVLGLTRRPVTEETRCPYVHSYRTLDGLPDVLGNCDYICNLLPSTTATRYLLSGDVLSVCENRKSVLISVSRGDIIDLKSLEEALKKGWLGGAILDVVDDEPLPASSSLWSTKGVVITPHISGWAATDEFLGKLCDAFVINYQRYVKGEELDNVLDWKQGY